MKKRGKLVKFETKNGTKEGRLYNDEEFVNGKAPVYTVDGRKLLVDPNKLILKGYFD